MDIQKEKTEVKFTLKYDLATWEAELDKAYKANAGKYKVQGFRHGKAPRGVIEKNYGTDVFVNPALQEIMSRGYSEILKSDPKIKPIDYPTIDYKITDTDITITGSVLVEPEFTLGKYTGHKIKKTVAPITDKDVDAYLTKMQENRAKTVEAKSDYKAKIGDVCVIDFVGSVDGVEFPGGKAENYDLELGSNSFIDTFEKQLEGSKTGDSKDVLVTFPKEYHAKELAGKQAKFAVKVNKILAKELPKLDDEFAKESSEFDTMAKWREGIKKQLTDQAENAADANAENELVKTIVEGTKIDIPQRMIDGSTNASLHEMEMRLFQSGITMDQYLQYTNFTMENLREQHAKQAEANVKTRLVFDAIIEKENLFVTDEEIKDRVNNKTKPDEVRMIKQDLVLTKLLNFLKEKNTIE